MSENILINTIQIMMFATTLSAPIRLYLQYKYILTTNYLEPMYR